MPLFNSEDLVGNIFLLDEHDDGQQHRARIVKLIQDHTKKCENNNDHINFLCSINNDEYEEIIMDNQVLHFIGKYKESAIIRKYKRITAHQGPLPKTHKDYKGST